MDQVKIGKFIAEMRREAGLTQDELGEKLLIKGQSVSKWERGINLPDVSILLALSEILHISVSEILNGEKNTNQNEIKEKSGKMSSILMKYLKKRQTKSLIRRLIIACTVGIFVFLLLLLYSVNNFNKFSIYSLGCGDDALTVRGIIVFNPSKNFIRVSGMEFYDLYTNTDSELKAKNLLVTIRANDKIILEYGIQGDEEGSLNSIDEILDLIFVNNVEPIKKNDYSLLKSDISNLFVSLSYIDSDDEEHILEYKLDAIEEFSNNKLFYK